MNKLTCLLLILVIVLQYALWLGKNGICDWIYVNDSVKFYENIYDVTYMKHRNNQLLNEIHDLLYEYAGIEERARYNLGMIRCDETFYRAR